MLALALIAGSACLDLPASGANAADAPRLLSAQGAAVEIPDPVVLDARDIRIERLREEDLPPLPPGLVNVTAEGGGYRFLPAGLRFDAPVRVHLPLEPSMVDESGERSAAARTYYWDASGSRWLALPKVQVNTDEARLVSETTHFTTMINAVLTAPDHPPPLSFNPNSIKDFAAADPAAGIDLIAPPQPNNRGTAELSFPIRMPDGRGAYQSVEKLGLSDFIPAGDV